MEQCPQCSGDGQADPEQSGVLWCLSCWCCWTLPRACPGRRPMLSAGLRVLADYRQLSR
ncbi:hypothetical protein [Streptomyces sp. 1222.5]|uniref:hypothetical protein n=1 Tax=Streptomyces sp. 1222.5 TaxID=1881026 RepID=UPI003EBC9D83